MPKRKNVVSGDVPEHMKDLAQENRENPTEAEAILWKQLMNKNLGVTFWRQHCLNIDDHNYIVDFFCESLNLVVEVDGPVHQFNQKNDAIREWRIKKLGTRMIRFSNEEVLKNPKRVANKILNAMNEI